MDKKYFLTVDWCSKGQRGVFCDQHGRTFWKANEPHTKDEMFDILGVFELVLAPESTLLTEDELKTYNRYKPLAEYSNAYGYAYPAA